MIYNSFTVPLRSPQYDQNGRLTRTWMDFYGGVARKAGRSTQWRGIYDDQLQYAVCDVVSHKPDGSLWIALQAQPVEGLGAIEPGTDDTVWEYMLTPLPAGGQQGQMLVKSSPLDYEAEWVDPPQPGGSAVSAAAVLGVVIDGGGSTPATGSKGYLQVPYDCTIDGWTMLANVSGSAQITVKKSTYAGFPATASIVGSAPPKLTSQQKNTATTLTGWTTAVDAEDVLEFNLDSITTITRVILEIKVSKS